MAQPNQNSNALTFAQNTINLAAALMAHLAQAQAMQEQQSVKGYLTNINAMQTYALNADGSQGATDGSPVEGNPIVNLNVTPYALGVGYSAVVTDLVNFLTGAASVAQTDRRPAMQALLS
jgi:hypothetical protein